MNSIHTKLLKILEDLILCIEGEWFLSDGALLGLIRDNKLIEYDDDIDIYLLPGSKINIEKLNKMQLHYQDYYLCGKVYDKKNTFIKKNKWLEYNNYIRTRPHTKNLNRAELLELSSISYEEKSIENKFTHPCIDIFYLREKDNELYLPYRMNKNYANEYLYFKKDIIKPIKKTNLLNVKNVCIPNDPVEVIKILYGDNWFIPKEFKCRVI